MHSGCLIRRIRCISSVVVPLNRSNTYVATSMVLTWNSLFSSFHDGGDLFICIMEERVESCTPVESTILINTLFANVS
jgi:hypothetical protein